MCVCVYLEVGGGESGVKTGGNRVLQRTAYVKLKVEHVYIILKNSNCTEK